MKSKYLVPVILIIAVIAVISIAGVAISGAAVRSPWYQRFFQDRAICTPEETKCSGDNTLLVCNEDGTQWDAVECSDICQNGECVKLPSQSPVADSEEPPTSTVEPPTSTETPEGYSQIPSYQYYADYCANGESDCATIYVEHEPQEFIKCGRQYMVIDSIDEASISWYVREQYANSNPPVSSGANSFFTKIGDETGGEDVQLTYIDFYPATNIRTAGALIRVCAV